MVHKIQFVFILLILTLNPVLAQELLQAEINSAFPEFGGTISESRQKKQKNFFYFNRTDSLRTHIDLMQGELNNYSHKPSTRVSFNKDPFRDIDPFINKDGSILYFSSNREHIHLSKGYNLWATHLSDTGWSEPEPMAGEINSEADEIYGSFTVSGDIYFARFGKNSSHIYYSLFWNGKYSLAEKVSLPIHDSIRVSNPAIAPDHSYLIFVSAQLSEKSNADLFFSRRLGNNQWTMPVNLGIAVNTLDAEFAPFISHDMKWLYFTSERPGIVKDVPAGIRRPGDIYRVKLKNIVPLKKSNSSKHF